MDVKAAVKRDRAIIEAGRSQVSHDGKTYVDV